jgi:hypothetical protein
MIKAESGEKAKNRARVSPLKRISIAAILAIWPIPDKEFFG